MGSREPTNDNSPQSFGALTVELIEQLATWAGTRAAAPIRAASFQAARLLMAAGAVASALGIALVFVGVAIGLLIGMAPAIHRWWICLVVAAGFVFIAAAIGVLTFRERSIRHAEQNRDTD
ncbi:MAG: hypothetical protein ACUVX8_14725 [Candidatus Zipacnadales bacterium]